MASPEQVCAVGQILVDPQRALTERFRALFTLKNLGGPDAITWISRGFSDDSALLKHELAYCLGQMQDRDAIPVLTRVLRDREQDAMVRHEAGEALGAIGDPSVLDLLREFSTDPVVEVAETCQLAVRRLEWLQSGGGDDDDGGDTYASVDPAPPAAGGRSTAELRAALLDEALPLFERYRAMFALRNRGSEEAALALADGLRSGGSALFRHEVGYVLGQLRHPAAVPALRAALERPGESAMVRHEAAEALGAIGRGECLEALRRHRGDGERVVKESCQVALDMLEYENSGQFQYADGLLRVQGSNPEVH
ncbi:deoxyhypusine hydroxylase [Salarias fasciatus]|uniref:Deoxyhypusine hydroxylase n=1 Tax=Salarias fasciatus TaxID=181472 RepID=A0A672F6Y1_SALFA|nr:deoxyhypusine hydroxylase [Salarias fasciatus]